MSKKDFNQLILIIILILLIGLFMGCIWMFFMIVPVDHVIPIPFTNTELKTLNDIDQIEIYGIDRDSTTPRPLLKIVDDADEVNVIVEKVRTYADGWQYPGFNSYYTPEASILVYFYRNGETTAIFTFGIGYQYGKPYIENTYEGKYLSEEEFKKLMETLGVEEGLAYP